MSDGFGVRPGEEIEALVVDRYLESLLARAAEDPAVERRAGRVRADLRTAAERLTAELPRLHPSFRFEERLALRLADVAASLRVPVAAGGDVVVAFDRASPSDDALFADLASHDPEADDRPELVRPLLIGGALTSAALSLAGAAYVAWRRTHPGSPMARAVRAVARGRLA